MSKRFGNRKGIQSYRHCPQKTYPTHASMEMMMMLNGDKGFNITTVQNKNRNNNKTSIKFKGFVS